MKPDRPHHQDPFDSLPKMPSWIIRGRAETLEDQSFLSGAALACLHDVAQRSDVAHALVRERLALRAAEACIVRAGRSERAADLRDAVHLLRPGDLPGPAGETYLCWRRAVERPISSRMLSRAIPGIEPEQIACWLDVGPGRPVTRAAKVLEAVLQEAPRMEASALILAEAALAQALGWEYTMPVLATGLKPGDLRKRGDALRMACHRAVVSSAGDAVRIAADVTRHAARLRAAQPKLRAKGAEDAVRMILSQDAVMPAALPLPDRAARRFCDRLVELGLVRELTGRDTFRLYGI